MQNENHKTVGILSIGLMESYLKQSTNQTKNKSHHTVQTEKSLAIL
jgi:hypothetical protein